jgi:hypothetical protein
MTDEDALKQALAELGDVVRCRCDEAYRDRGLQDPQCNCDSMDAARVVIARIEWLERERVLDAKLLADTQALLDTALEAVIDAKLVAEAKVQALEAERDAAIAALPPAPVDAQVKRLCVAAQKMVTLARKDGWAEATTGRQIILRAVQDALAAIREDRE